jgi:carboxymethylenebutenolidase
MGLGEPAPTVTRSPGIKGKIVCFFGAEDGMIPATDVETIRKSLYDAGVRHEIFSYPSAGHAFFCEVPARGSFRQMAHDDAWKKVKKLFLDELHAA